MSGDTILLPIQGALVCEDKPARGWGRTVRLAAERVDALINDVDIHPTIEFPTSDVARMHSTQAFVNGSPTTVTVEYVTRTTSSRSRMLRVTSPGFKTMLLLNLHEHDTPEGWDVPSPKMGRRQARRVIGEFASILRSLGACSVDLQQAVLTPFVERGRRIGIAMGAGMEHRVVRMPWTMGTGLFGRSRMGGPSEPIPAEWASRRITLVKTQRDRTGLLVQLSPVIIEDHDHPSAVDAMRATASLPPIGSHA